MKVIFIIVLLTVGILAPKLFIHDSITISLAKTMCGILGAHSLLENPMERLWIMKLSAKSEQQDNIFVYAYTFFGVKYAEIKANCSDIDEAGYGGSAEVLRRGLFF